MNKNSSKLTFDIISEIQRKNVVNIYLHRVKSRAVKICIGYKANA